MAWERIVPQIGARSISHPRVTLAYRMAKKEKPKLSLTTSVAMTAALGWASKQRVHVDVDRARALMRVAATDDTKQSYVLHKGGASSILEVSFVATWMTGGPRPAESIDFQIEDGALIVALPEWARPAVEGAPTASAASADKAPALEATPPATTPEAQRGHYRTEARSDLLRRLWPDPSVSISDIRDRLSRLDGPEIPDSKSVFHSWAERLRLPTARTLQPGFAPEPAAAPAPPPATPPISRGGGGLASRAALPAAHPDQAEAMKMLEAGVPARTVADEFGLSLATVATWAADVRARKGKAA